MLKTVVHWTSLLLIIKILNDLLQGVAVVTFPGEILGIAILSVAMTACSTLNIAAEDKSKLPINLLAAAVVGFLLVRYLPGYNIVSSIKALLLIGIGSFSSVLLMMFLDNWEGKR